MGENFNNNQGIEPAIEIITDEQTLGYPIYSVTIMNDGDNDAVVQGKPMPSGATWTFAARNGQVYLPNTFALDGTGTQLTLLINK
jgi:hypothetical protein